MKPLYIKISNLGFDRCKNVINKKLVGLNTYDDIVKLVGEFSSYTDAQLLGIETQEMASELGGFFMKEDNIAYVDLSNAIRWDNEDLLAKALSNTPLDLTYDNGTFFNLAVDVGDVKIVKMLIGYFFAHPADHYKQNNTVPIELILKKKLHDIIEVAVEDVILSDEMKELLSEYTSSYEDTSSDLDEETKGYEDTDKTCYDSSEKHVSRDLSFYSLTEANIETSNEQKDSHSGHDAVEFWFNQIPRIDPISYNNHQSCEASLSGNNDDSIVQDE